MAKLEKVEYVDTFMKLKLKHIQGFDAEEETESK